MLFILVLGGEIFTRLLPGYNREWMDYNPVTVWRLKANNKSDKWTQDRGIFPQQFNGDGFYDLKHTEQKLLGVKRIMVIGDSYTAGLDYPIAEGFTGILQQKLNDFFPGKYEVMNCGVPAWGLEQEFLYFVNEGQKYKPDYVLVMVAPNDVRETYTRFLLGVHDTCVETRLINPLTKTEKMLWKLGARSSLIVWTEKKELLPTVTNESLFMKYFGRSFPDFPPWSPWDLPTFATQESPEVSKAKKRYATILEALNTHCKAIDAKLMVSIIPTREEFDSTLADTAKYQPGRVAYWLDTLCTSYSIPYCKTFDEAKRTGNPLDLFESWEFHFDRNGHDFMGDRLFQFFQTEIIEKK